MGNERLLQRSERTLTSMKHRWISGDETMPRRACSCSPFESVEQPLELNCFDAPRLRELEVLEKVAGKANLTVVLGEQGLTEKISKLL
jgi:hypothetical protein